MCSLKIKVYNPGFWLKLQKHSLNFSLKFNKNMHGFSCADCHDIPWNASKIICTVLSILLEKAMVPHSSTHAWKIPWMEEPMGYSPWGRKESGTTERLHFHFSLSFIGEGDGNPLQCSCLENPWDGGAWWAAIYGVT